MVAARPSYSEVEIHSGGEYTRVPKERKHLISTLKRRKVSEEKRRSGGGNPTN